MAICTICNKGELAGRNVRHKHSGLWERKAPATARTFHANIQKRKVMSAGITAQLSLCTKCIKKIRKEPGWKGLTLFSGLTQDPKTQITEYPNNRITK